MFLQHYYRAESSNMKIYSAYFSEVLVPVLRPSVVLLLVAVALIGVKCVGVRNVMGGGGRN
jgi:hypothetical protein